MDVVRNDLKLDILARCTNSFKLNYAMNEMRKQKLFHNKTTSKMKLKHAGNIYVKYLTTLKCIICEISRRPLIKTSSFIRLLKMFRKLIVGRSLSLKEKKLLVDYTLPLIVFYILCKKPCI